MINPASKSCFVIAPIGQFDSQTRKRSNQVYNHIISPVLVECGYSISRADNIDQPGIITNQIVDRLLESDLVIADLSERNANVFYELGLRHAIRKPVIHLVGSSDDIPFDNAAMRAVLLDVTDLDVVGLAKEAIRKQILAIEDANYEVESPFTTAIDVKALRVGGNEQGVVIANIFDRIDLFTDTVIRMEERLKSIEINSEYVRRPIEPRGLGLLGRSLHSRGLDEVSDSFGINPDPSYLEKLIGLQRANDALDPKKAVRSTSNAPEKKKAIF